MFMKTLTITILKRHGFRSVLIANALLASASVAVYGLFTEATPHIVLVIVFILGGCLRSLQFTSLNAISFADIASRDMSQATSLSSMGQRLSQSLGVAIGAYALELSSALQGHSAVETADFWPAFLAVALLASSSILFVTRLPRDAGAELSGQKKAEDAGQ